MNLHFQPGWSNRDQIYPTSWKNNQKKVRNIWNNCYKTLKVRHGKTVISKVQETNDMSRTIGQLPAFRECIAWGAGELRAQETVRVEVMYSNPRKPMWLDITGLSTTKRTAAWRENSERCRESPWEFGQVLMSTGKWGDCPSLKEKTPGRIYWDSTEPQEK